MFLLNSFNFNTISIVSFLVILKTVAPAASILWLQSDFNGE